MSEQVVSSKEVFRGRIITLKVNEVRLPNGRETTREIVEHPGAVVIAAVDAGNRIALVRQFRSAVGQELLELPAGTREPNEGPLACAQRELAEEMGVQAANWRPLSQFYSAPGFCTEQLWLYLATDLTAESGTPDADEQINRQWIDLKAGWDMIETGQIRDAKSITGLLMVLRLAGSEGQSWQS
ncbi:MAG TPA: NUDIX hydrolase [Chloroflexota bacterium]|nr:NUDIX hydrolase [Chloroflexota bacterium]